jgi:hypothetical protein
MTKSYEIWRDSVVVKIIDLLVKEKVTINESPDIFAECARVVAEQSVFGRVVKMEPYFTNDDESNSSDQHAKPEWSNHEKWQSDVTESVLRTAGIG